MSISKRHIIHRVNLDIEVSKQQNAHGIKSAVLDLFRQDILPKLEQMFDELSKDMPTLRLDHLDLDFSKLSIKELQSSRLVTEHLKNQLAEVLVPQIEAFKQQEKSIFPDTKRPAQEEARTDNRLPSKAASNAMTAEGKFSISAEKKVIETFLYFLKTGRLPWWAQRQKELLEIAVLENAIRTKETFFQSVFIPQIKDHPVTITRLVRQFEVPFIHFLIKNLISKTDNTVPALSQTIFPLIRKHAAVSTREIQIIFYEQLLFALPITQDVSFLPTALERFFKTLFTQKIFPLQHAESLLASIRELSIETPNTTTLMIQETFLKVKKAMPIHPTNENKSISRDTHLRSHNQQTGIIANDDDDSKELLAPLNTPPASPVNLSPKNNSSPGDESAGEASLDFPIQKQILTSIPSALKEGVFIENAGLVLLNPYLIYCFKGLALLDENVFKNEKTQTTAIQLLHYISTGQKNGPEHELFFNKILCGFPTETPIDQHIQLSETMLTEADQMLQAVLKHWTALKNTSPDGLRANFLLRSGRIQHTETAWKLTVESKPQDILLNQLPWGIGNFKLPWMKQRISVDWFV